MDWIKNSLLSIKYFDHAYVLEKYYWDTSFILLEVAIPIWHGDSSSLETDLESVPLINDSLQTVIDPRKNQRSWTPRVSHWCP